jgi:hypothetical protein
MEVEKTSRKIGMAKPRPKRQGDKMDKLSYNKREAAEMLGISLNTLNRYKNLGKIPHRKIGDRVLFTDGDLTVFLDSCAVPATSNLSEREKLETLKRAKGA